ncbi:transcriptional regulator, Sir2 family, partial [Ostertagia ostertagi]
IFSFIQEIFPGQFEPSISHKFIRQLEVNNQLLRNYTQNIDTLEKQAKIEKVVECHGSFSKATCLKCLAKFEGDIIKDDVMAKRVARCPKCLDGVIKPDIVFFGEELDKTFHTQMAVDKDELDLLRVARCPKCLDGVIKPDIVFFGEELDKTFHTQMAVDKDELDLLVVIGSRTI